MLKVRGKDMPNSASLTSKPSLLSIDLVKMVAIDNLAVVAERSEWPVRGSVWTGDAWDEGYA
jgi:hypothetical protein